jgi:hypothetical protein
MITVTLLPVGYRTLLFSCIDPFHIKMAVNMCVVVKSSNFKM